MGLLIVHLRESFKSDTVKIAVNGREAYVSDDVTTDWSIGVAARFETPVPDGPVDVSVELPARHIARAERIACDGTAFVGISLRGEGLEFTVGPDEPPMY